MWKFSIVFSKINKSFNANVCVFFFYFLLSLFFQLNGFQYMHSRLFLFFFLLYFTSCYVTRCLLLINLIIVCERGFLRWIYWKSINIQSNSIDFILSCPDVRSKEKYQPFNQTKLFIWFYLFIFISCHFSTDWLIDVIVEFQFQSTLLFHIPSSDIIDQFIIKK